MSISNYYPTARPKLNLDFLRSNRLDPRITFTRASQATRIGPNGLLQVMPDNTPRFDYDPVTGACKGLLIEEARTNFCTYSEQFDNATWTATQGAVGANTTVAPNGTVAADTLTPTAAATFANLAWSGVSQPKNGTYSGGVYVKANGIGFAYVAVTAYGGNEVLAYVNLTTGATSAVNSGAASGAAATAVDAGGGWWRVSVSGTPKVGDAATGVTLRVGPASNGSQSFAAANGTSGIYVWGAQLEAGAFPTSYIPTTAAATTRAAEYALMTGTNFSSWFSATEGTFVASAASFQGTSGPNAVFTADDGTGNNRIQIRRAGNTKDANISVFSGGVQQINYQSGANTWPDSGVKSSAIAYKANDFAATISGSSPSAFSGSPVPAVNRLTLGSGTTVALLNGHIRRIAYWDTRLPNNQLQGITR